MNRTFLVAAATVAMVLAAIGVFGVQTAPPQSSANRIGGIVTDKQSAARHDFTAVVSCDFRQSVWRGEC